MKYGTEFKLYTNIQRLNLFVGVLNSSGKVLSHWNRAVCGELFARYTRCTHSSGRGRCILSVRPQYTIPPLVKTRIVIDRAMLATKCTTLYAPHTHEHVPVRTPRHRRRRAILGATARAHLVFLGAAKCTPPSVYTIHTLLYYIT